jgi:hypothetical protein
MAMSGGDEKEFNEKKNKPRILPRVQGPQIMRRLDMDDKTCHGVICFI